MPFPNDLTDVKLFKIHPAIGIARLAKNDDYYVFGTDPGNYKSNKLMKRQAVQFRIFAYAENHRGLGELTEQVMAALGIVATWTARVANRKIARLTNTPLEGTAHVISAEGSASGNNSAKLVGSLPDFEQGQAIPLGEMTGRGLFVPAKGGVFRKAADSQIERWPAQSTVVADTTCDGSIGVRLEHGGESTLPVLPACILVAPQDFSPDKNEAKTLYDLLYESLSLPAGPPPQNLHNELAQALDRAALLPGTSDFNPGVEIGLQTDRTEVQDLKAAFFSSAQDPRIDPREIRVKYRTSPGDAGVVPGQLTSGLCSTWQGDYQDCINYWTTHLPGRAFLDEDTSVQVHPFRKNYDDHSPDPALIGDTGDDIDALIDRMGVVRIQNSKPIETERDPGDNV